MIKKRKKGAQKKGGGKFTHFTSPGSTPGLSRAYYQCFKPSLKTCPIQMLTALALFYIASLFLKQIPVKKTVTAILCTNETEKNSHELVRKVLVHKDQIRNWNVSFCGGRQTGERGEKRRLEKSLRMWMRTNDKCNPLMMLCPRF